MTGFENAEGILLLRQGCYSVQAHPVFYYLMPGSRLVPQYHICGEVLNPIALMVDALIYAGTGKLPDSVMVFSMEKHTTEGKES